MARARLVFCFDGTSNDPNDSKDFFTDNSISNVLKLHLLFGGSVESNTPFFSDQRSFYYTGVGTRGGLFRRTWNTLFAPRGGDIADILKEAARDLRQHYSKGDQVYIFGFSRGAAIARMFAAKIQEYCPDLENVSFLGVFDTVAATKGSFDLNKDTFPASSVVFENETLGAHVRSALHLVALDERRIAFQPTLFNYDKRVKEIWFPGAHSDVGGGFWFDGLSDISLEFMHKEALEQGLSLRSVNEIQYEQCADICLDDVEIHSLYRGVLHEQRRSGLAAKTLAPRYVRIDVNDRPSTHNDHIPIVHHSVQQRFFEITGYRPFALRNVRYKLIQKNGSVEDKIRLGIEGLRST